MSEARTRRYETMMVFRTDLPEGGVQEQTERARGLLDAQGARDVTVHELGTRELAYKIRKEARGVYVLVDYEAGAAAVLELERNLKLSDAVLRFVSVRQDEAMAAALRQREEERSAPAEPSGPAAAPEGTRAEPPAGASGEAD